MVKIESFNLRRIILICLVFVALGIFLGWKFGVFSKQPMLNTNMNNATTTQPEQLNQEEFKQSPLYKVVTAPLSKKYVNAEMGFSLLLPEKVIVKKGNTYFNSDPNIFKIVIDESGYESSITDLWGFYPDNKNPARNATAKSIEDYLKDYPAPDVKNHTVVIHKNERISENALRQEYSYGSWQAGADNKPQFFSGTSGCDACYSANHYIRYVYFNPKTKKFVILERAPLNDEFHQKSVAFREKESLAEKIAKTLVFE